MSLPSTIPQSPATNRSAGFPKKNGLVHHVPSDHNLGGFAHLQAVLVKKDADTDTEELEPLRVGRVGGLDAGTISDGTTEYAPVPSAAGSMSREVAVEVGAEHS